jgi:hypothetical protein
MPYSFNGIKIIAAKGADLTIILSEHRGLHAKSIHLNLTTTSNDVEHRLTVAILDQMTVNIIPFSTRFAVPQRFNFTISYLNSVKTVASLPKHF